MKMLNIVVLMRFPKFERSEWKYDVINDLIINGYNVSLVFAYKSYLSQLIYAYRFYGNNLINKKSTDKYTKNNPRIYDSFINKIDIVCVNNENSEKTEKKIKKIKPDILLLLGTGIIRKNILQIPRKGTIHIHQGSLPKYRGVNTIEWSLYNNDDIYISAHYVNPGVDTGDIIEKVKINYTKTDSIESIRKKCKDMSVSLILRTINKINNNCENRINQKVQDGKQYFEMHPFFKDLVEKQIRRK